jgi:hypothetical protein
LNVLRRIGKFHRGQFIKQLLIDFGLVEFKAKQIPVDGKLAAFI